MEVPSLRLRAVREAQGKSLGHVSAATGIDKAYLSRIERGLQRPSVRTLRTLAAELGLKDLVSSIDRLLP